MIPKDGVLKDSFNSTSSVILWKNIRNNANATQAAACTPTES
ncbi:hypothetical protein [Sphingobacterium sp. FBM7-1]|nr:hypothetical protein [Sphingobacterium sp. FBM7-1]